MIFRRFSWLLGLRVVLLVGVLCLLVFLLLQPGYVMISVLLALIASLQVFDIVHLIRRTNRELSRFLDAVRYADFGQRFELKPLGAGFGELGEVFTDIVQRFQQLRNSQEESLRHLRALMEHVPVPLLSVYDDDKVELQNNAARRLFGSAKVERMADLAQFGEPFMQHIGKIAPGERRLAVFHTEGAEQRFILSATEIAIAGRRERLVSLQNIQSELDGVQLEAWQDLVRVLTHEIMNSITPVASLAKTAADLVDDASGKLADYPDAVAELDDVRSAVSTVARRSDGLMHFVQGYRQLTRLPPPARQRIVVADLFNDVLQLTKTDHSAGQALCQVRVEPQSLSLDADPEMLEQVLLNLLRNAQQALASTNNPEILLQASLNRAGHICVVVSDNGPGIDPEIASKIFVPFFTTKRDGSGVGLALTRQIMLAHGGTVVLGRSESGGAKFTLTF